MTTIDAAAARNVQNCIVYAALAAALTLGVSGCTTGGGILNGLGEQQATTAQPAAAAVAAATRGTVAIAPIIGPPDTVSNQLTTQLTGALKQGGIAVAIAVPGQAAPTSDYTLRGYIVAARESAGTKVSYIWDVANPAGHRVNRITGEEVVAGNASADPLVICVTAGAPEDRRAYSNISKRMDAQEGVAQTAGGCCPGQCSGRGKRHNSCKGSDQGTASGSSGATQPDADEPDVDRLHPAAGLGGCGAKSYRRTW